MTVEKLKGMPYCVLASIFCLFMLSFYFPVSPKALFYAGLTIPGLIWLLRRPSALPKFFWAFGYLLLPLAIIQLININHFFELKLWLYMVTFLACCVMVERSKWGMANVYRIFAFFSIFVLLYSAANWIWLWYETGNWVRYYILFTRPMDPNNTALLISCALVFIWLFQVEPELKRRPRIYMLTGLFVLSGAVLLSATISQSRSALVGFGLFLAAYILRRRYWWMGLGVVLGIGLLSYLMDIDGILSQRGFSYRPQIWMDAWNRIYMNCGVLLGCGEDGYHFLNVYTHTHNLFIGILYNDGLVGLALIGLFLFILVREGVANNSKWFLIALVGFGGLMTNTGWLLGPPKAFWVYFWLPVLMTLIEIRHKELDQYLVARTLNKSLNSIE